MKVEGGGYVVRWGRVMGCIEILLTYSVCPVG